MTSRAEALFLRLPHYDMDRPCKRGHLGKRDTKYMGCLECGVIRTRAWRDRNPEASLASTARSVSKWRANSPDKVRVVRQRFYQKNRTRLLERDRRYREINAEDIRERDRDRYRKNPQRKKDADKRYKAKNPETASAHHSRRRYAIRRATPPWLTRLHRKAMSGIRLSARALTAATGIEHHVDHIYPLRAKISCGLHVPWNLQIMAGALNCSKQNKNPEDAAGVVG